MSRNNIIKKSNNLVEAAYNLSLWEMRILLHMTSLIHVNDKDFMVYDINIKELKEFFGVENEGSIYQYVREACLTLMDKKVIIKDKIGENKTKETTVPMVIEMSRIVEEKTTISLSFHPKMKPYLLELKSKFLSYDVKNVLKLSTSYAIRLYELTKAYAGIGKRTISIEELKSILGISDKYKQYTHLKHRVLEPSKKNINDNTDIILDYKEIKKGRRVDKIQFIIKLKKALNTKKEKLDTLSIDLKNLGVVASEAKKWREKYSNEYISERIKYTLAQRETVKNKAAYLSSIMGKELKITPKMDKKAITKKVNAILFSRPQLQQQIEAKHGQLSQEAMNAVVKKMFPEKFEI